jgi:hypothetical protein
MKVAAPNSLDSFSIEIAIPIDTLQAFDSASGDDFIIRKWFLTEDLKTCLQQTPANIVRED